MDNIKLSIFDVFAYLLPGSVILLAFFLLLTPDFVSISEYVENLNHIDLGLGIGAIMASYIIGHVSDNFGMWLYYKIGCKIWGNPDPEKPHSFLTHSGQRSLIRKHSPENYASLEILKVFKSMSHNLAFAFLLIFIVSLVKIFAASNLSWMILSFLSILFVVVFLNRASKYDKWYYKQMVETVRLFELDKTD